MMINRRRVMGESGLLPSGYIQLEYIASSGTQYINMGTSSKYFDKVELDFYTESAARGFMLVNGYTQVGICDNRYGTTTTGIVYKTRQVYNTTTGKFIFTNLNNSTQYTNGARTYIFGYLFALPVGSGVSYFCTARVYGCRFYAGDETLLDLYPAQRISDDELGMYDLISGTFFTNQGTGSFIAGPRV